TSVCLRASLLILPTTADILRRSLTKCVYFQLQLGCVLRPVKVNCRSLVPSASIIQISSLPERLDWNTMCRPSGAHDGESLRPPSWVSCTHCLLAISTRERSRAPRSP